MRPFLRSSVQNLQNSAPYRRPISTSKPPATSAPKPKVTKDIPSPAASSTPPSSSTNTKRIDRILSRSPKFFHKYVQALRTAPVSHITSFLLLHELTAVVPLFGLAGAFHYYNWLPSYFAEGAWVLGGVERFGRYFKRKGWISEADEQEVEREAKQGDNLSDVEPDEKGGRGGRAWDRGEGGVRLVVEFATAYAIVKALMVPRLIFSAWAAPAFARWSVIPVVSVFKRSRIVQSVASRTRRKKE